MHRNEVLQGIMEKLGLFLGTLFLLLVFPKYFCAKLYCGMR